MTKRRPTMDRFWEKVDLSVDGCWLWTAGQNGRGYGWFRNEVGKGVRAYLYAYRTFVGEVPVGRELDHLCRVRLCVRPDHLEPVTPRQNTLRGVGPTAVNSVKTHCVNGHRFDDTNTIGNGSRAARRCRECHRQSSLRRWQRLSGRPITAAPRTRRIKASSSPRPRTRSM